ncbi:enoyl-CoA hydratase-related protein [Williamsia soli]|uniref:enoyl-CoA hydratase-related protein n=1 Tax=Williamsia soli TaxID=364929 RepID=UPI001A9E372C|nr:enoyl-CoA hydratase-related protein [Williamsia soli]
MTPSDLPELVRYEVDGVVATITLDSPANRNALSSTLCAQLLAHLRTALDAEGVRVVVLSHTGTVFCAGADLKESATDKRATSRDFAAILETLWVSTKPVVVRVAGTVRAGGTGLIAAADFAVAAESVNFAFTEIRLGVVPAVISAPLRHTVVAHALYRLFLTGETFSAEHAVNIGLLTAAVRVGDLDDEVARIVEMVILAGPLAWAGTKKLMRGDVPSLATELVSMQELSVGYFESPEGREGVRALVARRTPSWATG